MSSNNGSGPVLLTSDELTGLRNRWETLQAQVTRSRNEQLLELMARESYTSCAQELRRKYHLPPQFAVDFDTGVVSDVEEVEHG